MNDRELRNLARATCTNKELDALAMHWAGHSHRTIADALGISRTAVRARLENANRKLKQAMKEAA